ncbi:MAG TPA: NADPH:quinone oxidoreductase family protein [Acetobacteraceae bacterium]|nr:NADPH:quinone oxidoreductase family protein [Acetobacteraceae bacterium]
MRAVICEAYGGPEALAVREVPDPPPPRGNEVQVRIRARGVQYVDVLQVAGKYQVKPEPPFIPGGEGAGEVIAIGPDVTRFRPGAPVMVRQRLGALAERANVPESGCQPIPPGLSMEQAGVFLSGFATPYHALLQRARLAAGEWVLVHGAAGGIGIGAIQVARLAGARVIATASSEEKRAACLEEGATHALDYRQGFVDAVKEITGGRGADIAYDPIGADVTEQSLRCLAYRGRLVILGFLGGGPATIRSNYLLIKAIDAIGIYMGAFQQNEPERAEANIREMLTLAGEGKLRPRISHRFALEEAAAAMRAVIDRKVIGKAVLVG